MINILHKHITVNKAKFLFLHQYKTVFSVHNKTHLGGPPMPKFEANMNYIPTSPPSSMKQCNKSATVKFHMELLLTNTTRKQSCSGATPEYRVVTLMKLRFEQ